MNIFIKILLLPFALPISVVALFCLASFYLIVVALTGLDEWDKRWFREALKNLLAFYKFKEKTK